MDAIRKSNEAFQETRVAKAAKAKAALDAGVPNNATVNGPSYDPLASLSKWSSENSTITWVVSALSGIALLWFFSKKR